MPVSLFLSELNTFFFSCGHHSSRVPHYWRLQPSPWSSWWLTSQAIPTFLATLDSTKLTKHVSFSTHRDHHILDLVITPSSSSHNPVIDHSPVSPSHHLPIFSSLSILPGIPLPWTKISFRCFKSISVSKFTRDILQSRPITHPPPNLSDLVDAYNSTLTSLIDIHAPLKTKTFLAKPINKWYTPALSAFKAPRRHQENFWLRTH